MVKKLQKMSAAKKSSPPLAGAVKESAQQIWLAGLGAFSKAQEGGGKVFEALMKEGLSIQRKTQAAAEEKISEATSKMANMAGDIQSKAGHQWDKLENIFEDRVAKALNKLGVPSAKDIEALIARIDELNRSVQKMSAKAPAAKALATKGAASKGVTVKVAVAKVPAKKAAPARKAAKPETVPAPAQAQVEMAADTTETVETVQTVETVGTVGTVGTAQPVARKRAPAKRSIAVQPE
ncbi:MAG: poly granule associated protein [Polaromonas sp.]|nr:MAG: poly granule associated protein [Polaromonas sp.]